MLTFEIHLGGCWLAVQDTRGKGKLPVAAKTQEELTMQAIKQGLQQSRYLGKEWLKALNSITGEELLVSLHWQAHRVGTQLIQWTCVLTGRTAFRTIDVWVLLLLHAGGGARTKAVEGILHSKAAQGVVDACIMSRAIVGHQVGFECCC